MCNSIIHDKSEIIDNVTYFDDANIANGVNTYSYEFIRKILCKCEILLDKNSSHCYDSECQSEKLKIIKKETHENDQEEYE